MPSLSDIVLANATPTDQTFVAVGISDGVAMWETSEQSVPEQRSRVTHTTIRATGKNTKNRVIQKVVVPVVVDGVVVDETIINISGYFSKKDTNVNLFHALAYASNLLVHTNSTHGAIGRGIY